MTLVYLPLTSCLAANVLEQQSTLSKADAVPVCTFALCDVRCLVVDDYEINLIIAENLLAEYKAQVETVTSGLQALEMLARNDYDIVFMGHMMPDMDGIETTERIRNMP